MQPLHDFLRDARYAVAEWLRRPLFAAIAIATIGLGIGSAVSVFTLVNALFLRSLPVPTGDRLMRVYFYRPNAGAQLGLDAIRLLRERATAFDAVLAHMRSVVHVRVKERNIEQQAAFVSANYFSTLGVKPRIGRFFLSAEDSVLDRDAVTVVSSSFWHSQLADDPNVIGRHIWITERDFTIIGVAPEEFHGVEQAQIPNDVWLPIMMARQAGRLSCLGQPRCRATEGLARLAPRVSREMADAQVQHLAPALSAAAFADDSVRRVITAPAAGVSIYDQREYSPLLRLLSAIATLILVIACANLSGLLVARGVTRQREMALRISLGASRSRLVRQLLTEGLLTATAGGAFGLLMAAWVSQGLMGFFATDDEGFHHLFHLRLDLRIVLFTLLAVTATVLLFGVLPAVTASRADPATMLKAGAVGGARARVRAALVGAQVTLSIVLLTAAGLLARSVANLMNPRAFDASEVAVMRWRPDLAGYSAERAAAGLQKVLERLRMMPNVEGVAYRRCCGLLWSASPQQAPVGLSAADTAASAQHQLVSPGFFATLKVPVLAGREFDESDREGTPRVAIVNRSLATKVWGESATPATIIGRELQVGTTRARVLGIVPDFHARTLLTPAPLVVFEPYWQTVAGEDGDTRFAIRVRGDAARAIPELTEAIAAVDPRVLVTESMPMTAQIAARFVQIRLGEAVLLTSATLALFLSALGVYGVVAFLVARRTKEIGILIALGAPRASVTSRFVRHGMQAVAVGTIVGVMLSFAARSLLRAWLVGVAPNDSVSFGVAVAVVIAVSLLASYLPARRASRTDPAVALRDA